MPQLNLYISKDLRDELDRVVAEMRSLPGSRASRSSVAAAALSAFFSSRCPVKKTKEIQKGKTARRTHRSE